MIDIIPILLTLLIFYIIMGYTYDDQPEPEQSKSKTKSKSVYIVVVENHCVRLLPRSEVTQALPSTSSLAIASLDKALSFL